MSFWDEVQYAQLTEQDLATIRQLERKLGPDVRLVAVRSSAVLYVLEAKLAPNQWERVDRVYEGIQGLKAYFSDFQLAREAKGALKRLLQSRRLPAGVVKRPIRIRQIVDTESEPARRPDR